MAAKTFDCIAALTENNGIGFKGDLPWRLPKEMAYFTRMTTTSTFKGKRNAVIIGRKSWEAIPHKYKPLQNRFNIILSRSLEKAPSDENVVVATSLQHAMRLIDASRIDRIWVIGGQGVYEEALRLPYCRRLYLTHILKTFDCDTFFPDFNFSQFEPISDPDVSDEIQEEIDKKSKEMIRYKFRVYEKLND